MSETEGRKTRGKRVNIRINNQSYSIKEWATNCHNMKDYEKEKCRLLGKILDFMEDHGYEEIQINIYADFKEQEMISDVVV